ncbi:MAG: DNA-methyltransferase [Chloroflexota bacterium]
MTLLPEASVDLVVTDPPFAIAFRAKRANYNRTASRVIEGYDDVLQRDYLTFTRAWLAQVHRLLKPSGAAFVFSGWNNLKDILVAADELGLVTVNHIIWKYQFGVVTNRRFVTSHYHCLYFCKDDRLRKFFPYARFAKDGRSATGRSLHYADKEDVWQIKREYWHGDRKTPTKLPAEVVRKILLYASEPGDIVLDPFLGSGQVAVVSKALGRHYLGYEIVQGYFDFAAERLASDCYRLPAEGKRPRQRRDVPKRVIELT